MRTHTLTIVGVGLIGGSIGLAARRRGVVQRVLGVGRQAPTLEIARDLGAIDEYSLDLMAAATESSILLFCTPVDRIAEQALGCAPVCAPGTLLSDAGSTKAEVVRTLEGKLPPGIAFVGGHPLAGSEKRGPEHARADLFEGRITVLTPTANTPPEALARLREFWESLGARVKVMAPEAHDEALALTSHLPHLLASALAGLLPETLQDLTATGFRDTTRIAAGDPALWRAIFLHNRSALLEALGRLGENLGNFRAALEAGDADTLDRLLEHAKRVRDALGN